MCRAPFIGQLDADDLLKRNAVRRLLRELRSDPSIGVVYSSSELIDAENRRIGDAYDFPHYSRHHLMYNMIVHHFRLFRARDWYRTNGFAFDIQNAVDYDMFLKLAEVTDMKHVPVQLYRYRKHESSTSIAFHGAQLANHRLAVQRSLDRRGLSRLWKITPDQPMDSRTYEFARRSSDSAPYGPGLDRVRISVAFGERHVSAASKLQELFPAWELHNQQRRGQPRLETRDLSHARAIRAIQSIAAEFPDADVSLVYA